MRVRDHIASNGISQIHTYGGGIDNQVNHWENLGFEEITEFSHGHHARAGGGNDVFNFQNLDNIASTVVGRLEDFDPTRDEIRLEGEVLDLNNLPDNVRIVEFNGAHNDAGSEPQQWLLIETSAGGHIFYALEGARIDMHGDGGSNGHAHENHFLMEHHLPDFQALTDVAYVNPVNVVPEGVEADGGLVINDVDRDAGDVMEILLGSDAGDAIAAGLNDDTVDGGDGNDVIWGGGGSDEISGGAGHDEMFGGTGNDYIVGATGADNLSGDAGNDTLISNTGIDTVFGGDGDDWISSGNGADVVDGGAGDDYAIGRSGADFIRGGDGSDSLYGSSGADTLRGGEGDDYLSGGSAWDVLYGNAGHDTLEGNFGSDVLNGGGAGDLLLGGTGDDTLNGERGADTLYGNQGRDVLDGGLGDDLLRGGTLTDEFHFRPGCGADTIEDFENTQDELHIDASLVGGMTDGREIVDNFASVQDGNIVFSLEDGGSITLLGQTDLGAIYDDIFVV